jgi:hypothetical protein
LRFLPATKTETRPPNWKNSRNAISRTSAGFDARDALRLREQEAEEKRRAYERLKFNALRQAFSKMSLNEQYTFVKIITEGICPSCGNDVASFAKDLERRQSEGSCVVCGSPKTSDEVVVSTLRS